MTLFPEIIQHDPGGKVRIRKPAHWAAKAEWGGDAKQYRSLLTYTWNPRLPQLLAAMMNPSTASEEVLDPTLAKVGRLTQKWGYGGFSVVNACDYRITDSRLLASVERPCSDANVAAWKSAAKRADKILLGYGNLHKSLQVYAETMVIVLRSAGKPLYALGTNQDFSPKHPLFVKEDTEPVLWTPRDYNERAK